MKTFKASSQCQNRNKTIIHTSLICIISNTILSVTKISLGILIPSIALISEGVNNATDSLSSAITILGIKLSEKNPRHRLSRYGERICCLSISILILLAGLSFLRKSVLLIFSPRDMDISAYAIIILALSATFKIFLSKHIIDNGKITKCPSLIAIGIECRNDFIISSITLISCVLFLLFHVYTDAYAGIISSFFILKSDLEILISSIKDFKGSTPL